MNRHVVIAGHLRIGRVSLWFVAAGLGDARFEIVGHQDLRHPPKEGERPNVAADPVRQALAPGGFDIGVGRCTQDRDEDLGRTESPRAGIRDRHGHPRIVDEALLSRPVVLPHDEILATQPGAIAVTEPRIREPVGFPLLVFLPEEQQGDPLAPQLVLDNRPVRFWSRRDNRWWQRKQSALQSSIIQLRGPGKTARRKTLKVFLHRCPAGVDAAGDRPGG